jgi:hypothetical protein
MTFGEGDSGLSYHYSILHRRGQILQDTEDGKRPALKTCQVLDFELEMVSLA